MFPRRRRARSHASFVFWAALAAFDHAGNIMTNYISVHVMARQVTKKYTYTRGEGKHERKSGRRYMTTGEGRTARRKCTQK
jgi:hypothetical protein